LRQPALGVQLLRKVEKAYLMRRKRHRITLAHESDFWHALASHGLPA
jgi:hypothetical protein